jgi:hypothetical protein
MAEEDKNPTFHIHNCPQDLIDRVKAKAALARKSKDLWVVELLQRETKKLIPIQKEYQKEDEERGKADDGDTSP